MVHSPVPRKPWRGAWPLGTSRWSSFLLRFNLFSSTIFAAATYTRARGI